MRARFFAAPRGLLAQLRCQKAELFHAFDRRLRQDNTQAKGRALFAQRKPIQIEWVEQTPRRLRAIAAVFALREAKSCGRSAIGSGIATKDLAQAAHALLVPAVSESELRELLRSVVGELAAWIASNECLQPSLGRSHIRREVAHRNVIGRALLRRHRRRAASGDRTAKDQHTRDNKHRQPRAE